MVGKTNVGSSGKLFAVIAVTYPEGSICTCSNGTKTLKARDTSGKALFNVQKGTWTVSCTDGTNTKTVSVEITTAGQSVSVTLSYQLLLYEAGNEYADITGGWEQTTSGDYFDYPLTGTVTFNADHIYLFVTDGNKIPLANTKNKIKFDGYSKLFVTFNSSSFNDNRPCVMCVLSAVGGVSIQDVRIGLVDFPSGAGTVELDISNIAEGYVAFYGNAGIGTTAKITKVWLEE